MQNYNTPSDVLRAHNKQKFIEVRVEQIKREQTGTDIQAVLQAEQDFKELQNLGFFDRHGYVKKQAEVV